jgi:hypothetical protein
VRPAHAEAALRVVPVSRFGRGLCSPAPMVIATLAGPVAAIAPPVQPSADPFPERNEARLEADAYRQREQEAWVAHANEVRAHCDVVMQPGDWGGGWKERW